MPVSDAPDCHAGAVCGTGFGHGNPNATSSAMSIGCGAGGWFASGRDGRWQTPGRRHVVRVHRPSPDPEQAPPKPRIEQVLRGRPTTALRRVIRRVAETCVSAYWRERNGAKNHESRYEASRHVAS
jgi:hypothetical protein